MDRRSTAARKTLGIALILIAGWSMVGCDDGGGGEESIVGMLMFDSLARSPELITAGTRIGLAAMIAQLHLTAEQASQLAELAREQGPAVRGEIDAQLADFKTMVSKMSELADQIVVADNPEQAMAQFVMDEGMMEMVAMFEGGDGPMAPIMGALDGHQDLMTPIVDGMDPATLAQLTGLPEKIKNNLRRLQWEKLEEAADNEALIDSVIQELTELLGYVEPADQPWAVEALRPLVVELSALEAEDFEQSLDGYTDAILVDVGPAAETLYEDASRLLVALIAHTEAASLLDVVAAK